MAEHDDDTERTEEPSQRKLDEAVNRGDVTKSQEVTTWFTLLAATVFLFVFAAPMVRDMSAILSTFLDHAHEIRVDGENIRSLTALVFGALGVAAIMPVLVLGAAGIIGNMIQHPPVLTVEPIKPKLSKISPIAGFKRLFSLTSIVNFLKGLAKLAIVGCVIVLVLWPERGRLFELTTADPMAILPVARLLSLKVFGGALAVLAIVAALDYAYQRHRWYERQRMSIKEVRDEHKQMEGDPAVRAKLRQIRVERGRKRMMAQVPEATVVITNPTHFAVALKYETGMNAPVCLAKGIDAVALRIRSIAEDNDVPIVENPPLARTLHAAVEIDEEIPPEHYRAVAEVIGYVMRLRGTVSRAART